MIQLIFVVDTVLEYAVYLVFLYKTSFFENTIFISITGLLHKSASTMQLYRDVLSSWPFCAETFKAMKRFKIIHGESIFRVSLCYCT